MYSWLIDLPRAVKRAMLITLDTALIPACLYLAFVLRLDPSWLPIFLERSWALFPLLTVSGIAVLVVWRLDSFKIHAFEARASIRFAFAAATMAVIAMGLSYTFQLGVPRSVPIIFAGLYTLCTVCVRIGAQAFFEWLAKRSSRMIPVAVYGAGAAGIQLVSALRRSREVTPIAFVDDNHTLHGLVVANLPVRSPATLQGMIASGRIQRVLIAIPSLSRIRRRQLIAELSGLGAEVQVLPSFIELMDGPALEDQLRTVDPDDLLGREAVDLDIPDVAKAYAGRSVMVTGAGGSIGSELCRQLVSCGPARVVLFELNEFALYSIDADMRALTEGTGIQVVPRLGSVCDRARVDQVIADQGVEIVLHAAAYKHVPLIEENEAEGAGNNVIGTQTVAEAARDAGLERFILVSTDKAVRPTNIMGATKRMAELVVQDLQTRSPRTKFAIVRFGNVLGSSGSVLPLFQRQIASGGPVTVTHQDVTRFFMTIPEASRLVLLAGAYAEGGDHFVLDMGEPRKVIDIARRMIALAGRTVREEGSEDGEIEIKVIGLRPGEKLYEELLIDNDSLVKTPHSKILRAEEKALSQIEVAAMMRELNAAIAENDAPRVRAAVRKWVEGYHPPAVSTDAARLGT